MSVVARFQRMVTDRLGLAFDDSKKAMLAEVLRTRLEKTQLTAERYLALIDDDLASLAELVTVNETYFFRNVEQFRALVEEVIPARLAARPGAAGLRVLSAGCSSGEEAYTIAMSVADAVFERSCSIDILGVDVNPLVLAKARAGRYSPWSLRETTVELQQRWFAQAGNQFILSERIRQSVRFEQCNLAFDAPSLLHDGLYDVIFCRNMLMYFEPEKMRAAVERLRLALAPGGYLFLGHAESLRGVSSHLALCHTHDTFYYRHEPLGPVSDALGGVTASPSAPTVHLGPNEEWTLAPALALLGQERYQDALALVRELPADARTLADVMTLESVLLLQCGDLMGARASCERLLRQDTTTAGAHYLFALCSEAERDLASAIEHDRAALARQPTFAMARLHLGIVARRLGDKATARHALAQAIELLLHEDPSRLALFGGGFSREALVSMCRHELGAVSQ